MENDDLISGINNGFSCTFQDCGEYQKSTEMFWVGYIIGSLKAVDE